MNKIISDEALPHGLIEIDVWEPVPEGCQKLYCFAVPMGATKHTHRFFILTVPDREAAYRRMETRVLDVLLLKGHPVAPALQWFADIAAARLNIEVEVLGGGDG